MTVKELQNLLKDQNPESEILLFDDNSYYHYSVSSLDSGKFMTILGKWGKRYMPVYEEFDDTYFPENAVVIR